MKRLGKSQDWKADAYIEKTQRKKTQWTEFVGIGKKMCKLKILFTDVFDVYDLEYCFGYKC